ncbi:MAG: NAD-dependent protein deacetylase [Euzebyales bacterium]|jgi:NAD-dependent SIR2 family protein deacetylase|nr:NAD-dependent protein deacetylase [Euzebyales bacterium]
MVQGEGDGLRDLGELVTAGGVLVLTGAGISTDSGIPDYRGPSGRLRHAAPMTYDRFIGSALERRRYWARSHLGWHRVASARPNVAHEVVATLEGAGLITGVATQNVDGLHTTAGSRGVIELHGRLHAVVCLGCGRRRPRFEVALRLDAVNPGFRETNAGAGVLRPDGDVVVPEDQVAGFRLVDCRRCGGILKPDVVFFGEHVPQERFRRALALLGRSSALLVLGSSLTVGSGYRFVTAAVRRRLPVAIVNRGATRGDRHAALKLDAALADVLTGLVGIAIPPGYEQTLTPASRPATVRVGR